ncbi:MAG: RNase P subunit p30 family protein [Candidatus Aenigmatarchaeota archaeon]
MDFYDLYIPTENAQKVLESAEDMKFEGLGIAHRYKDREGLSKYLNAMDKLSKESDIKLVRSCVIDEKSPGRMKKAIGKVRQKVDVVAVDGGNFDINNAAVRDRRVDILLHPEHKRKDAGMDHKTVKIAAKNEVALGFVLHDLHQTYGKVRSHVLRHMKKNFELCERYSTKFLVTSGAHDVYELRAPRDLASLPKVLGVSTSKAIDSVSSVPKRIVKENRKKLAGDIKKEGVEEV